QALGLADLHEAVPELARLVDGAVDLEPIFSGVAGARYEAGDPIDLHLAHIERGARPELTLAERLQDGLGLRPLNREHAHIVGAIRDGHIEIAPLFPLFREPGKILGRIGSIDHEEVALTAWIAVDQDVVDDPATGI